MNIVEGILLGAVQGLTEFIPVSSSGHLVIVEYLFGIHAPPVFASLVNLGTFLALLVYFRTRILGLARQLFVKRDYVLLRNIIISALPVGVIGFLWGDFFEQGIFQNPVTVVVMLVVVGVVMIVIDKIPRAPDLKDASELSPAHAGLVGAAQAVALIPGTSRSASTMIAGRLLGLSYRDAAEYSFLLSIPIMAGVILKSMMSQEGQDFITQHFAAWCASNVVGFITGIIAVSFMLRFLSQGNLRVFGYYRVGLAAIITVFLLVRL